jgi:hypothetical protein
MSFSLWGRRAEARKAKRPPTTRPVLEQLEGREVPSSLAVSSGASTAAAAATVCTSSSTTGTSGSSSGSTTGTTSGTSGTTSSSGFALSSAELKELETLLVMEVLLKSAAS